MIKQSGISLVEVLVSLFLASMIMTLLIQYYLGSKRQYLEAEKILEKSFELQWISDLLSDGIRRAGFTPCVNIEQLQVIDHRGGQENIHALKIENQPYQALQINRMHEEFAKITKIVSPRQILVQNSVVFHKKRPILIADCEHAEVHELFSVEQQEKALLLQLNKPLVFSYSASAYVGAFLEERWLIRKNATGDDTLHYHLIQTEEITSLIHSLHIDEQLAYKKQLLKVVLGLDEQKTYQFMVAVRG